jgi:acyl-CoA thioesterase I
MRFLSLSALALSSIAFAETEAPIKWACIGNSITQGPSATDAYPAKLQKLLGPAFQVENDGSSGRTLLKKGDYSYWTQGRLANVFAFKPDIVSIKLGTNDSKPVNWDTHKGEFEGDLLALIDTLGTLPTKPKIYLVIPCPAFSDAGGAGGIRGSVITNEIIPIIKKVAAARNLDLIDVYTPMLTQKALFPDNVHPTAVGHDSLAAYFFRTHLSQVTRIACIGNSITHYAFGTPGTVMKDAYPMRLNMLLGRGYWVENDGQSGAYMMKVSPDPYYKLPLLGRIYRLAPNIVTIKLGTNDPRLQYWNRDAYMADYKSMLDTLNNIGSKPKIYMCLPAPSFKRNGEWQFQGINDSLIVAQTIPAINQVAADRGLTPNLIDLHAPMAAHQDLLPDGVHPNAEGQDSLAHLVYRALKAGTVSARETAAPPVPGYPDIQVRHGILTVTVTASGNSAPGARAVLYDISGKQAAEMALKAGRASSLSLEGMAPGRYFLAVETRQGHAVKTVTIEPEHR